MGGRGPKANSKHSDFGIPIIWVLFSALSIIQYGRVCGLGSHQLLQKNPGNLVLGSNVSLQQSLPKIHSTKRERASTDLVSHYSAIGDTISCDAPYRAIGFKGKLLLRYTPC